MRPSKEAKRRSRSSSPIRDRTRVPSGFEPTRTGSRPSVSLLDRELATDDNAITLLETNSIPNPRSFPYSVKQQCWDKAEKIKGRDPDRWRRDALGNIVFRKLVGCPGCLCHDYDHILPYSKGGQSTLENCQVLQVRILFISTNQLKYVLKRGTLYFYVYSEPGNKHPNEFKATVNRSKGNRTELSRAELIQKSSYCRVSGRDMDLLELSAFGNVRRGQDSGGCRIQ